ncbi:MAG: efflux RND transporter permease subunit [Candidatus Omnitrophota bacterium]|jgi:HAE1 family hydrophobic/amphiphilic exporter-1
MIEFFVKRPVTTIMFICVFVVLGLVSYGSLLVESTPKIDFPIVTVSVVFPGATPLDVETLVVNKVEDAVSEISEIKKIRSQSYEGFGYVYVEFLLSADVNVKSIEVKDKVEAILNDLPEAIEKPIIEKYDPLMTPVMDLVLSSSTLDGRTLYEYADKVLRDKLSSVKDVAKVDVYGGKERQINIRLDPMLMKERFITIQEVITALRVKNMDIPAGNLEKGDRALSVRFVGEFQDTDEIANMALTSADGDTFSLKDIAVVEDGFMRIESIARYNGKDVVGLSLKKVSDGNAIVVATQVRKRLDEFRGTLPDGMDLDIATDTTKFVINETKDTQLNILIGILLTVIILYLFTGRLNLTFIAVVVIPSSLISTFALMNASKFTINMATLLAIATSMGTLIANAIVIIENVLEHLEHKESAIHAAIDGTKEVTGAILASAGTNLVVFTPIAMMGGIPGQFMKPFGLTVVYATLFSLIASFSLTPMLCAVWLKKNPSAGKSGKGILSRLSRIPVRLTTRAMEFLKKEYKYIFETMFRYPKSTILVTVLAFFSLVFVMPYLENEFMTTSDQDKISIQINLPQGSTIERTLAVVKQIETHLDTLPEKMSYMVNIGDNGAENANITLDLVPSKERRRSDLEVISSLIPFLSSIPDTEAHLVRSGLAGGLQEGDVSIDVYGIDYDKMIELSCQLKSIMEATGYFRSVGSSYKVPKAEARFIPDQDKLIEYGLNAGYVGASIRASIYGDDSNVYKEGGEEYDINVELDDRYAQTFDDIQEISVISPKGLIPITELGLLTKAKAMPTIWHRDKSRVIRLEGYLSKGSLGLLKNILNRDFGKIGFPKGYGYSYVGDSEYQEESGGEMSKAFTIAVILTFMLLCAIMNSFKYPIPILLMVPASFIGVFYAMFFLGASVNMASMLTMVMLVGLVVNNAILLLDYALVKIRQGMPVKEALWQGASVKFRAILMTSIAIILGILPQLWVISAAKRSMSVVMMGGMAASILFTFISVPVIFWYIERFNIPKIFNRAAAK